jgi:hypothetical protein
MLLAPRYVKKEKVAKLLENSTSLGKDEPQCIINTSIVSGHREETGLMEAEALWYFGIAT